MKSNIHYFLGAFVLTLFACSQQTPDTKTETALDKPNDTSSATLTQQTESSALETNPKTFIPKGFNVFETVQGDLNNDGTQDIVYVVKNTLASGFETDENSGEKVDRNRRGLVIVLNKETGYELLVSNPTCFSSENEDGGVYYAPELSLEIKKNKLYLNYEHGRYGYWKYTLRATENDMELIGYDNSENYGPVVKNEISINFLTRKKQIKQNTNMDEKNPENAKFVTMNEKITMKLPILLSGVKNFDELYF